MTRKKTPLFAISLVLILILPACGQDESSETTQPSAQSNSQSATPQVKSDLQIGAGQVTTMCENWTQGQRVQYRLGAPEKIRMGVSFGREFKPGSPVSLHITKSEVRSFTIRNDGEYCFQFDNRSDSPIAIDFEHKTLARN